MPTIKPSWYIAFERQQLTERQMLVLKQDDLVQGTRPPSAEQLLKLLAHVNKNKQHLWLQ
jgi:hypothetical protein